MGELRMPREILMDARAARFPTALWEDPEWTSLTAGAQLFAMTCLALGKVGPCSDARIQRKTEWTAEFIRAARSEVEGSRFGYMLIGTTKRRRLPRSLVAQVLERDGYTCVFCSAIDDLQIDHIHPVKHGGSDDIWNLQVLCGPCNRTKGAKILENPKHQT